MYGTIARLRLKPGMEAQFSEVWQEIKTNPPLGHVSFYVYQMDADPNEYYVAVVFESKAAYHANAGSPSQDVWYRKLCETLVADPAWHDGEIMATDGAA